MPQPLVSVIIPAFNASNTLDATLRSVRDQTHRALEILVVDDGSIDDTAAIVDRHTREDGRVRLLAQSNGGVARARNRGIAEAAGDFVAPLDADDVWHPEKIARQVAAIIAAGADCGLAYNWYRRIDAEGRVVRVSASPDFSGRVLFRHLYWNFIANGSTPLVRTATAKAIGFDPALRDAGVQGCEDYLFQLRVAHHQRFVCVPAFLTGYRVAQGAMSSATTTMIRSEIMAYSLFRAECEDAKARALIDRCIAGLEIRLARNRLRRAPLTAIGALSKALGRDLGGAVEGIRAELRHLTHRKYYDRRATDAPSFAELDAEGGDGAWTTSRSQKRLAELAVLDGA